MTVNLAAPIASLDATIPAATVDALAEGGHVVSIRSQDAAGNWGDPVTVNLVVDKTGPGTSGVSAAPTPSNGTVPFNASTPAVRRGGDACPTRTRPSPTARSAGARPSSTRSAPTARASRWRPATASSTDPSEGGYADIPLATDCASSATGTTPSTCTPRTRPATGARRAARRCWSTRSHRQSSASTGWTPTRPAPQPSSSSSRSPKP